MCILLVACEAGQPSRQPACPGGRPRLLDELRCEAVLVAVDWRDLIDGHALQASVGARAPDNGGALPIYRVSLVEITPPMQSLGTT